MSITKYGFRTGGYLMVRFADVEERLSVLKRPSEEMCDTDPCLKPDALCLPCMARHILKAFGLEKVERRIRE